MTYFPSAFLCPYCQTRIETNQDNTGIVFHQNKAPDKFENFIYFICPVCHKTTINKTIGQWHKNYHSQTWSQEFSATTQIFPSTEMNSEEAKLLNVLPHSIAETYKDACSLRTTYPKAAAALARLTLESFLKEQGIIKKKLNKMVKEFCEQNETPKFVKQSLESIRLFGNAILHGIEDSTAPEAGEIINISKEEASLIIDLLTRIFTEYYVEQPKIENLYIKIQEKTGDKK